MNGTAIGPMMVLAIGVAALVILVRMFGRRGRRRGGFVAAGVLLLLATLGVSMFFVRATQSRAKDERDRAIAYREQAIRNEIMSRKSMVVVGLHPNLSDLPKEPNSDADVDADTDSEDESSSDSLIETPLAAVEQLNNTVDATVANLERTRDEAVGAIQKTARVHPVPAVPPAPPVITVNSSSRSKFPDRSSRTQIVTGILLAGVVLAGYFFLNANTRGHFTWSLRVGSTLVFLASLAVILLITNHM